MARADGLRLMADMTTNVPLTCLGAVARAAPGAHGFLLSIEVAAECLRGFFRSRNGCRLAIASVCVTIAAGASAQSNVDDNAAAAMRGWRWWKSLSDSAREQLAPKLVESVGNAGAVLSLGTESVENVSRYRAFCAIDAGVYRETALCKGLQFRFGERSAWSAVFLGLRERAGASTAPAREAAAIIAGLRVELGLEKRRLPGRPQYLIGGLYGAFGDCAPPSCAPALQPGTELARLLSAATEYVLRYGNDEEVDAGKKLQKLGWRQE